MENDIEPLRHIPPEVRRPKKIVIKDVVAPIDLWRQLKAARLAKYLLDATEDVPEEFRDNVNACIAPGDYDGQLQMTISYERPETNEE